MPPAVQAASLVGFVEIPLETVKNVVDMLEAGVLQYLPGIQGAHAASAYQQDRAAFVCDLSHVRHEIGVDFPIRSVVPGNMDGSYRMPDE